MYFNSSNSCAILFDEDDKVIWRCMIAKTRSCTIFVLEVENAWFDWENCGKSAKRPSQSPNLEWSTLSSIPSMFRFRRRWRKENRLHIQCFWPEHFYHPCFGYCVFRTTIPEKSELGSCRERVRISSLFQRNRMLMECSIDIQKKQDCDPYHSSAFFMKETLYTFFTFSVFVWNTPAVWFHCTRKKKGR